MWTLTDGPAATSNDKGPQKLTPAPTSTVA
jgi:hypothetical protein